jgi:choline dehydrogenase-like flavoprotein
LETDEEGNISSVLYYNAKKEKQSATAKEYVVACQAIETSRLLLASTGSKHPEGIGNHSGQLGKNIIYSAGGTGQGDFLFEDLSEEQIQAIDVPGLFINRHLQEWYYFEDEEFEGKTKGGIIDFLWRHTNSITRANLQKRDENRDMLWGKKLKRKMESYFKESRHLRFEVFNDWLPNDNCFVSLDPEVKDVWGDAVAKIRIGYLEHDLKVGRYLSKKATAILEEMGAKNVYYSVGGSPPANLQAGGCRFGNDAKTSVLDANCKVHGVSNLHVTDGSFMPTGGSVPYTFTIYANAFRVADVMLEASS